MIFTRTGDTGGSKSRIPMGTILMLNAILATAGPVAAQKDKPKGNGHEFDKVIYLYGPTAKQAHDALPGESAKGILRFDPGARTLAFTTTKGPGFHIAYNKIRKFESQDASLARQGAFMVGAGAGVLMMRQKKHFLVIHFVDENKNPRLALLQLDKDNFLEVLTTAQQETGLTIGEPGVAGQAAAKNSSPAPPPTENSSTAVKTSAAPPQGAEVTLPGTGLKVRLPSVGEEWNVERFNGDYGGMDTLDRVKPPPPAPLVSLQFSVQRGTTDCQAYLSKQAEGRSPLGLVQIPGVWPEGWAPQTVTDGKGGYYRVCRSLPEGLLDVQIYNGSPFGGPREAPETFAPILNALARAALAK